MHAIDISVPAVKENIKYLDEVILMSLNAFEVKNAKAFQFALHEVIINSIQACERSKNILDNIFHIKLNIRKNFVEATVIDNFGGGGDKDELLEEEINYNPLEHENSRGILLIDHLVDEFTWTTKDDGTFEVYISVGN